MADRDGPPLSLALAPRSIAVVGASEEQHKIGGRPIMFMKQFNYQGRLYPINAKRATVQGIPALPSLAALPEVPDMAVIVLPGEAAVLAIEECAAMGVGTCLVLSSGFAEITDPEGAARQARIDAAARASGMRIIGPNSQGLANFATGAIPAFSTMFIEFAPADGPIGIVSQSGGMAAVIYSVMRRKGLGVRYVNATGNDSDVTAAELGIAMAHDPDIRLLLLYIESISDAGALAELGRVARARGVPVLVLKGGSTALGQTAAQSHTAALMNEDRTVTSFLEAHGIWRAADLTELTAAAQLHVAGAKVSGRRIVSISNSGAACVLAADAISRNGLALAQLRPETKTRLMEILPGFASAANPVDITAALLGNSRLFSEILPVISADGAADAFVISVPVLGAGYDVPQFGKDAAAFAAQTGKPVVISAQQPEVAAIFAAEGLPVFGFEHEAVAALGQFLRHGELMAQPPAPGWQAPVALREGASVTLSEAESLARLARAGVKVPDYRLCATADGAAAAYEALGGAVALKGSSRAAPHKSELGIVRLGLRSAEAVRGAFADVAAIFAGKQLPNEGALVTRMAAGRLELLIGGKRDPVFGPVVTIGAGGKYVEVFDDLAILTPPVTAETVERALGRLRIGPIVQGVREEAPVPIAALADLLARVAAMMADGSIESIDLNPVFADEHGLIIADALIVARE
jgi:acetate---CoA ligase (ADP-forming)